ncbi:MAG: hypothetical protein A2W31_16195 [Planctomycetes bacterium RBG_16_64_10]|nr:MAG: hypothetical protein A2W31_16195 [Planctomycetes bacterium RBG_16_64_10]
MARPLRIQYAGAHYHVMSRGNERRPIVRDEADRDKRLEWLRRTVEDYGWQLHAFVLMDNHDHLFVETPEPNLSAGMQFLNGSYTTYFNRRHRRVGHLFQGRYKAQLIEEEGYYLEVSRYIHLNPVRARRVERPEQYPWSSYPGYHRSSRTLNWVTYRNVLGEFGVQDEAARPAYRRFVLAGMKGKLASPFARAFQGMILGSDNFVTRIRGLLAGTPADPAVPLRKQLGRKPSLEEVQLLVAAKFDVDPSRWSRGRRSNDAARAVVAYVARHLGYPSKEVAAALGYASTGGVAQAVKRIETAGAPLKKRVNDIVQHMAGLND